MLIVTCPLLPDEPDEVLEHAAPPSTRAAAALTAAILRQPARRWSCLLIDRSFLCRSLAMIHAPLSVLRSTY
jgi:hypothetical protein